jgi:hypothetical protein
METTVCESRSFSRTPAREEGNRPDGVNLPETVDARRATTYPSASLRSGGLPSEHSRKDLAAIDSHPYAARLAMLAAMS